jgi:hypothetical protein
VIPAARSERPSPSRPRGPSSHFRLLTCPRQATHQKWTGEKILEPKTASPTPPTATIVLLRQRTQLPLLVPPTPTLPLHPPSLLHPPLILLIIRPQSSPTGIPPPRTSCHLAVCRPGRTNPSRPGERQRTMLFLPPLRVQVPSVARGRRSSSRWSRGIAGGGARLWCR